MKIPTKTKERAIQLYVDGLPMLQVSKICGVSHGSLQKWLKANNLTRSNSQNSRKYTLQYDWFETIDTEAKAYWLGFLYADGYVSIRSPGKRQKIGQHLVGCSINIKDHDHLVKFKHAISATYPIHTYEAETTYGKTICSRLLMTSEKTAKDLIKHGLVEHKSLVLTFPDLPTRLTHHFIRGYFDGDGSFSKASSANQNLYTVKICGTHEFLDTLSNHIGFPNRNLTKRYDDDTNNYCLEIGGRLQTLDVGNFMYQDATVYMERKHRRYLCLQVGPTPRRHHFLSSSSPRKH